MLYAIVPVFLHVLVDTTTVEENSVYYFLRKGRHTRWDQFEFMGIVAKTKFWSLQLHFVSKMASSHDATSPCDLLQGLVASCVPTLKVNSQHLEMGIVNDDDYDTILKLRLI